MAFCYNGAMSKRKWRKIMEANRFSSKFKNFGKSGIREVLGVGKQPGAYDFSAGFPAREVLPMERIQELSQQILSENFYEILQYALTSANPELVSELTRFFNSIEDLVKEGDDIMVTSGSGEGLEMSAKVFCDEGDTVIVEDPTFVGALNAFKSNGAKLIGVPLDDDGMNLELLEKALQTRPTPKMLYIIPTFQNPTCMTTPLSRRKAIYELCLKYGVTIIEDNPYGSLRFKGEAVPSLKAIDTHGIVVYLASLSKIISPGIRIGTVVAAKEIVEHYAIVKGASGGAVTNWTQYLITKFLQTTDMDEHIARVADVYRQKGTKMFATMKETFHPDFKIIEPEGGMFVWFDVPEYVDPGTVLEKALAQKIAIVPGDSFATDYKSTGFRLSYTSASLEQIDEGIRKLAAITHEVCA